MPPDIRRQRRVLRAIYKDLRLPSNIVLNTQNLQIDLQTEIVPGAPEPPQDAQLWRLWLHFLHYCFKATTLSYEPYCYDRIFAKRPFGNIYATFNQIANIILKSALCHIYSWNLGFSNLMPPAIGRQRRVLRTTSRIQHFAINIAEYLSKIFLRNAGCMLFNSY